MVNIFDKVLTQDSALQFFGNVGGILLNDLERLALSLSILLQNVESRNCKKVFLS